MDRKYLRHFIIPAVLSLVFGIGFQFMVLLLHEQDIISYFLVASVLLIAVLGATGYTFISQSRQKVDLIPYLIHPIFLLTGITGFLAFNENLFLQIAVILFAAISYFILFSENFSDLTHHAHDGVKFFIILLLYDSVFEGVYYLGITPYAILALLFFLTLLLQYHMLWRLRALHLRYGLAAVGISLFVVFVSWFLMDYYKLSSYLPLSIMILSTYYLCWGVLHHVIERNLTARIFFEYLLVCIMVLIMFFGLSSGF